MDAATKTLLCLIKCLFLACREEEMAWPECPHYLIDKVTTEDIEQISDFLKQNMKVHCIAIQSGRVRGNSTEVVASLTATSCAEEHTYLCQVPGK